ncbi:hypothetical protein FSP39_024757 [Pinctada imbricata]|uniref:DZIP3-like HEPN domain-containing protein n=1 Tax=Pinctada imbricata TaxID=66713 RepID=A0AA88XNU1_PINIB|nr:hypothetical protein FSP39_024757 [Pinctada imbricata]
MLQHLLENTLSFRFSIRRITHGEENYIRFGKAIVGIGTSIIQQVLDTHVPSSNIAAAVVGNVYLGNKLTPKQKLLISQAHVAGYKDFDITLCYTLLRNVKVPNKSRFPAPTRGWGNQPLATDTTLSDDIERLRILRNEMFCHLPHPSIPIVQFTEIWTQLADICSRFKVLYPNSKDFCQELRKLELCNVTRVQWSSLVTLVEQCRGNNIGSN